MLNYNQSLSNRQ